MNEEIPSTHYLDPLEFKELERTLIDLDDVVFENDWDTEFVEDMCQRVMKYGKRVIFSVRQWQTIQRLKEKHLQ